jgi:hypothetical protein
MLELVQGYVHLKDYLCSISKNPYTACRSVEVGAYVNYWPTSNSSRLRRRYTAYRFSGAISALEPKRRSIVAA